MKKIASFNDPNVSALFDSYAKNIRQQLLFLRELIFETAQEIKEVGELEETIKWGQPSYLTTQSKSGTLIRIDAIKKDPTKYAMYFHCQTKLIPIFRKLYSHIFEFQGNRAIIFDVTKDIPIQELKKCIAMALTYYLIKPKQPKKSGKKNFRDAK